MSNVAFDARASHLKQIHVLQKAAGLSKEDAQALKIGLTGVASSADMTSTQRSMLIAHLTQLARRIAPSASGAVKRRPAFSAADKFIWAMWQSLADKGAVSIRSGAGLEAFVKKNTGVDKLAWLTAAQKQQVAEQLKLWLGRLAK